MSEDQYEPSRLNDRRVSDRRASVQSELEPLLKSGFEPQLYQTLSVSDGCFEPKSLTGLTSLQRDSISRIQEDDDDESSNDSANPPRRGGALATISVLLLGVFISQTDQSFVLATYGAVSSEFDDLASGSWLISAYILASCVFQPLYGKMSDIYGARPVFKQLTACLLLVPPCPDWAIDGSGNHWKGDPRCWRSGNGVYGFHNYHGLGAAEGGCDYVQLCQHPSNHREELWRLSRRSTHADTRLAPGVSDTSPTCCHRDLPRPMAAAHRYQRLR